MSRPRLLDLFCGAGGAAMGYHRAGFDIVGVDIRPQPNYPFEFFQADALHYWDILRWTQQNADRRYFAAIHASPPCQFATDYIRTGNVKPSPNLIAKVRGLLWATGLPYVIENVQGAEDELNDPVLICGSMFDPSMDIRRHRLFETNWPLDAPMWPCRHKLQAVKRFPGGRSREQGGSSRHPARMTVEVGTWDIPLDVQQKAMGIDWMTLEELSEAIPPAYTELIGHQLLAHIQAKATA